MSKQLTLIFKHFETEHLGKDVFLVPYFIGKKYGFDVTIVYPKTPTNALMPSIVRGVRLHPIKANRRLRWFPIWRTLPFYLYLLRNAKHIDFLMRFHHQDHTYYHAFLYKLLNKKGILYLKLDGFPESLKKVLDQNKYLSRWQKWKFKMLVDKVDRFSIETQKEYNYMLNHGNKQFSDKLRLLPNGFDEDLIREFKLHEKISMKRRI